MKFVMFEKTPLGYTQLYDGSKFWTYNGELHKQYGPAMVQESGIISWWQYGEFIKSINVEDDDVQMEQIIENVDFVKIHKTMTLLDWKWGAGYGIVPNIEHLKIEARRLLNDVRKYRNSDIPVYCSCGGFETYAYKGGFSLKFVLTHWNTDE